MFKLPYFSKPEQLEIGIFGAPREEGSSHGLITKRSIKFPNRISITGCEPYYNVSTKLFKNEGRRGSSLDEVTSTVDSLEASKDITDIGLTVDIHERSEGSEDPLLLLG